MKTVEIRKLQYPEIAQLERDLHSLSHWLPYRGIGFDSDKLQEYYLNRAIAQIQSGDAVAVGAFRRGRLVGFQLSARVEFLSEYFGIGSGSIALTGLPHDHDGQPEIANALCQASLQMLKARNVEFVSASAYTREKSLIHAFENSGFYLVEIFVNYSQDIVGVEFPSRPRGFVIRDCVAADIEQIKKLYESESFPGRLVSESRLPRQRSYALYGHRFEEVFEKKLGRIFIAEQGSQVLGALIGIIDEGLYEFTGIRTNALSGMGIIVDRGSRGMGVATHLIAERMRWYQDEGVQKVSFGASIDNVPMIRGLSKLGMKYTSATCAFHKWI